MHPTSRLLAILALLAVAAGAGAQNHPENFLLSGSSIQLLQGNGTYNTLFNNSGSAHGVTSDLDNRNVLFSVTDLFRVDPATQVVTTVFPAGLSGSNNVTIDHNGDYIMTGIGPGSSNYSIFRIRGNSLTTIATMMPTSGTFSLTGGLLRDIDTGNFACQVYGGSSGPHPIISVAPDGTYTTIVTNISTLGGPRYEFAQDIGTGNFYTGINDSSQGYLIQATRSGATSVAATSPDRFAFNAIVADRASSAARRLIHPYIRNIYYTDLKTFTVTSVAVNGSSVSPRDVDIWQARTIQPVRTAPGRYTLQFSFPGQAGLGYVAGLSLSGVRPGIPLADGRTIWLNPDVLVFLSVNNLLPGIFNMGPAILDRNGEAQGSLDVSALPPLGVPVHLLVLVLDPRATSGIAVVSDPYVLPL
jgi:hypothetical protein